MKRKAFIQILGAGGLSFIGKALRGETTRSPKQFVGVLTDLTRCTGCRACEKACAEVNGLPMPDIENDNALKKIRDTSIHQRTVVNRYKTEKGDVFVKKQCMHCWQPACSAACLTNAMHKTKDGPIIWKEDKCMGCRFCMLSCPFYVPKFEYHSWNPRIIKCDMCWNRLKKGKIPACVEVCPNNALTFGLKKDLMEIARTFIYGNPDKYVSHIYGEHEAGGAGWLYISPVPFDKIGFRMNLGNLPFPEYSKQFLFAVPAVLLTIPPLLYGLNQLTKKDKTQDKSGKG